MPSREYYLKDKDADYTQAYLTYMINVARLLGANATFAASEMRDVLDFEIRLANVRHIQTLYNVLTRSECREMSTKITQNVNFKKFMIFYTIYCSML